MAVECILTHIEAGRLGVPVCGREPTSGRCRRPDVSTKGSQVGLVQRAGPSAAERRASAKSIREEGLSLLTSTTKSIEGLQKEILKQLLEYRLVRGHSAQTSTSALPNEGRLREEVSVEVTDDQDQVPRRKPREGLVQLGPPLIAFSQRLLKSFSTWGGLRTNIEMLIANKNIRRGFTFQAQVHKSPLQYRSKLHMMSMIMPQVDQQENAGDLVKTRGRPRKPAVHMKREVLGPVHFLNSHNANVLACSA